MCGVETRVGVSANMLKGRVAPSYDCDSGEHTVWKDFCPKCAASVIEVALGAMSDNELKWLWRWMEQRKKTVLERGEC